MIELKENESRLSYLLRALEAFMESNGLLEFEIEYDGAACDGACLIEDMRNEIDSLPLK